jgi:hypothetical protein
LILVFTEYRKFGLPVISINTSTPEVRSMTFVPPENQKLPHRVSTSLPHQAADAAEKKVQRRLKPDDESAGFFCK